MGIFWSGKERHRPGALGQSIAQRAHRAMAVAATLTHKQNDFTQANCEQYPENQQRTFMLRQPAVWIGNQNNQNYGDDQEIGQGIGCLRAVGHPNGQPAGKNVAAPACADGAFGTKNVHNQQGTDQGQDAIKKPGPNI